MKAPKFKDFITEEKVDQYRLVILSHDDADDPNKTGDLIREKAKKLGIKVLLAEFIGAYVSEENDKLYMNSFPVEKGGAVAEPDPKKDIVYEKPFEIDAKNTVIMIRGLGTPGVSGNRSWYAMTKDLEYRGFAVINSAECHDICSDKWMNQIVFERHKIDTPKTVRVLHSEGSEKALEELDSDFPIILKTGSGSRGVGVILVESAASCASIVQLLYRENPFIDILLQEKIETKYDVRVIVCGGEIIGAMKRPVVKGDFRSNVSQGSEPEPHKLTELEKSESLRASKAVDGQLVGVDFIPATDREKEKPYFIEVNSTPGLIGIDDALSVEGSVVEKILTKFKDRQYWKGNY
jgi:ribosomal protein S6--L-glutamate ligase